MESKRCGCMSEVQVVAAAHNLVELHGEPEGLHVVFVQQHVG